MLVFALAEGLLPSAASERDYRIRSIPRQSSRRKDRIVVYQLEGEQLELPTIEESAFEVQGVGV